MMHISSSLSELCHFDSQEHERYFQFFGISKRVSQGFSVPGNLKRKIITNIAQISYKFVVPESTLSDPVTTQADCFFKIFMADSNGKEVPVSPVNGSSATTITHSMAGHLGNLTPQQEQAFNKFIENLTKANLYTPGSDNHEASHDDATLLCAILLNTQCCQNIV